MARPPRHRWDLSPKEAIRLQAELAARIENRDRLGPIRTVAGVDVALPRGARVARAAAVLLSFPGLEILGKARVDVPLAFPYVPGLLSFRETPAALAALDALGRRPDLLLCDGHGIAHPRRFGVACHMGLLLDLPAIGCAKSRLVGTETIPGPEPGDRAPLMDKDEVIGWVVRTRAGARPIYISNGHRVSLETAVDLALRCGGGYRLPEPTRLADKLSKRRT